MNVGFWGDKILWYDIIIWLLHPSGEKGYFCKNISEGFIIFYQGPRLRSCYATYSFVKHLSWFTISVSFSSSVVKGLTLSHFPWAFLQYHFHQLHNNRIFFFKVFSFTLQSTCIIFLDIYQYLQPPDRHEEKEAEMWGRQRNSHGEIGMLEWK